MAISGLHLSFIGVGVYRFLRRVTGFYLAGGVAGISFLILYVLMIGFTVSAVRALIMFLFRVGADMAGRHYDSPTALSVSAVIVLIWRPLSIYDGGFWLSFGAVAAVVLILPVFSEQSVTMPSERILQGLWASVSINLMLLPVLLYYFYEFPVYSTLLNLFVIPLMTALLFLGITGSVGCMAVGLLELPAALEFLEIMGTLPLKVCGGILWLYEQSCKIVLKLPGARIVTGQPQLWQIVVYYVCLAGIVVFCYSGWKKQEGEANEPERKKLPEVRDGRRFGKRKHICCRLCLCAVLSMGTFSLIYRFGGYGKLQVTVLDVGQGDCIFIKDPSGMTYLADGGSSDVENVGQYRIEPFLKAQGVKKLNYIFVSHGDNDHISGIKEMLARQDVGIEIERVILPVRETWEEELRNLAVLAVQEGTQVFEIEAGQTLMEEEMLITCLHPGKDYTGHAGNSASMVLAFSCGEFDMLLTGDVEAEGEELLTERLTADWKDRSWEVLKVAHHGSKNSSSAQFLKEVQPVCSIISAGQDNGYGHPHEETMERLKETGSKVYSTQESGAITMLIDGEEMSLSAFVKSRSTH